MQNKIDTGNRINIVYYFINVSEWRDRKRPHKEPLGKSKALLTSTAEM